MLSLKLLRETLADPLILILPHHHHPTAASSSNQNPTATNPRSEKTLALVFAPTNEVVVDTYRLASIARDIGMNLNPTPSLSHIIFSASSVTETATSLLSFSSSMRPPNDAVPLPFPSLIPASACHLRALASLSNGYFKLVHVRGGSQLLGADGASTSNWESSGMELVSRRGGRRIDTMDQFSGAMAGAGWTLFKTTTMSNCSSHREEGSGRGSGVYLYRKLEPNRVRIELRNGGGGGEGRLRELRLPLLDFKNAPLKILQYIILMTDDVFYLS